MDLREILYHPPEKISTPRFLRSVLKIKISGSLHVLQQWLEASKGIIPENNFKITNTISCGSEV